MRYLILFLAALSAWGQVEDYGRTANAAAIYDLTASAITRSIKSGASDPATCTSGKDLFINTSSTPVVKLCTATNTWTTLGSSGSAATLTTPRAIYGNNFDGSAALTQIIASTYGGTGNGFTKFSGPASSEKTFTLPNASATILTDNALVTAAQGGTGNGFFAVTGPTTSTKTFTFPNASATVLTSNAPVTVAQGGTGVATLTGIVKASGTSNFAAATYSDIVGLWTTCTGFLKNDGTCASAGTGNMSITTQAGAPSGACTAGSGWVLDTTAQEFYACSVSGTWKRLLSTTDTGTAVLTMLEGTAPGAGSAAGVHNLYFDSADHKLKSHVNAGSVVTYYSTLNPQTTISGNAGTATTLATPRAIYGNNFDGSAALTGIIASTYGGTGNGFAKFSGPATTEKTFTLPNASATILTDNAVVTVAQGGTGAGTLTGMLKGNGTSAFTAATAGTDYVSPSSTETLTNKTLDAEGTGNSITIPVKIWLPAVGCAGTTGTLMWDTLASNAPTATCSAGSTETTMMRGVADFPDSDGAYSLQQPILLPDDWSGAVDIKFLYRTTATTGNTVWQVATSCRADAEVDDAAFNTADALTADAAKGTTNQLNIATKTGITTTGCAAGELLHLKILRDRTHASDTITGVISLVGVELTLRRTM